VTARHQIVGLGGVVGGWFAVDGGAGEASYAVHQVVEPPVVSPVAGTIA
jgi:hypothetical protein